MPLMTKIWSKSLAGISMISPDESFLSKDRSSRNLPDTETFLVWGQWSSRSIFFKNRNIGKGDWRSEMRKKYCEKLVQILVIFCCMFCLPWRKNIIIKNWWFLAVTGAHSCCKVGPASKCFETNDMHYNDWTVRLPESLPRACRMGTWLNAILRGITTSTDQLGMILILRHNMMSSRLGVHTKRTRRDQYDRIKPI